MQNTMFLRSKWKERRVRATLSVAGVDVRTKIPAILGFQVLAVVLMKRQVGFSLIYGYFKILHNPYFYCMHGRHKAGGKEVVAQDVEFFPSYFLSICMKLPSPLASCSPDHETEIFLR